MLLVGRAPHFTLHDLTSVHLLLLKDLVVAELEEVHREHLEVLQFLPRDGSQVILADDVKYELGRALQAERYHSDSLTIIRLIVN